MLAFISRRMILAVLTIWVVSVLAFAVIQLPPGDLVDKYIDGLMEGNFGSGGEASLENTHKEAQYLREYYGLDKPYKIGYG